MYSNTLEQPKCSSFSFSSAFKKALGSFLTVMESLEKAHRVNHIALRVPYDAEAVKREMFKD